MGQKLDIAGLRVGRLLVIEESARHCGRTSWRCVCDCGREAMVLTMLLHAKKTKSCGCLQKERAAEANTTHGDTANGRLSKEYRAWRSMRERCESPSVAQYKDYGGRGISVCKRWEAFKNFLEDMGRAPSAEHSLDRLNVNGRYTKNNCRWATKEEQMNNTRRAVRVSINGKTFTISEAAVLKGISPDAMRMREFRARKKIILNAR